MRFARMFSVVLLLGASAVSAQVVSATGAVVSPEPSVSSRSEGLPAESNTYGTSGLTWMTFTPWDFHPVDSTTTYGYTGTTLPTVGIYRTGGNYQFAAGLHLPEGAVVSVIEIAGCDTNATQNLSTFFLAALKTGAEVFLPGGTGTTGSLGCVVVSNSAGPFTWTVNNDTTYYTVGVSFGTATDSTLILNSVRVGYKLQVSPAPSTARFTDVPTTHVFFQYIEALAASGITSGCTASTYCPDAPLTRGQMAVFLAKALGLHWAP